MTLILRQFQRSYATKLKKHQADLMARSLPKREALPGVKDIIVVASGKGGVGKSTVAANFACSLAKIGARVGLLDGDIFGPSVPLLMNVHSQPNLTNQNLMIPPQNYGVKCLSMGMLTPPADAIIWRGPLVMSAIQRLLKGAVWQPLDILVIDTPPGTGDVHLSLTQHAPITGVLLVTTPHKAAVEVTIRGAEMYRKLNVPILGLVENMRYSVCGNCHQRTEFFKNQSAGDFGVLPSPIVSIPLESHIAECGESGVPIVIKNSNSECAEQFGQLARQIWDKLQQNNSPDDSSKEEETYTK